VTLPPELDEPEEPEDPDEPEEPDAAAGTEEPGPPTVVEPAGSEPEPEPIPWPVM
jgi:hypothetical protein